MTDDVLKSLGLARNVILSVPDFQFLIASLKQSDLVAMVPARLALNDGDLTIVESPVNLPDFELVMLWHERSHRDPAHQWLRTQFVLSTANI
ncbi:LysR substrate-binding domain-containing protein [Vibrio salinus]|uniref:LysR substrate-binding domain-containing protein n=1 Tax=Vibrio salinus TaxID=2899784 RepID=UPI00356399E2